MKRILSIILAIAIVMSVFVISMAGAQETENLTPYVENTLFFLEGYGNDEPLQNIVKITSTRELADFYNKNIEPFAQLIRHGIAPNHFYPIETDVFLNPKYDGSFFEDSFLIFIELESLSISWQVQVLSVRGIGNLIDVEVEKRLTTTPLPMNAYWNIVLEMPRSLVGRDVSLTVVEEYNPPIPPIRGVTLEPRGNNHDFGTVTIPYEAPVPHEIIVHNSNPDQTGELTFVLLGENAGSFTLTTEELPIITLWFERTLLTIAPNADLAVGTHTATVVVSDENGNTIFFDVSFTVKSDFCPEPCDDCGEYDCDGECVVEPPPEPCPDCGEYDCDGECEDVSPPPNALQITPAPINFGTIQQGSPNPGAIPITITNTGDVELTLNPLPQVAGFTFGNLPNPVLEPGKSRTIAINVNANLPVGTHNTIATITTVEGASATVDLRFTVTAPQNNNNNNPGNNNSNWNNNRPSGNVFTHPPTSNNATANNNSQTPVERTFTDVSPTDWFAPYVSQAVESGLLNGVCDGYFAPNAATTRAMFVTVLWRLAGSTNAYNGGDFSDIADDSWYSQAIAWAAANGIVSGVGNGYFAPNVNITREQMGLILYRYVGDAVDMVMDRNYVPQNTATRAEMAAVMLRLAKM